MNIVSVGVDVAQKELVVSHCGRKPFSVRNDAQGCREFAESLPAGSVVHAEASGGYERTLCRALDQAGVACRLHNPLRVRRMAQATGSRAKTDALDASALAGCGPALPVHAPKSSERQGLCDLSRTIDSLKSDAARHKKRLGKPELDPQAREILEQAIQSLEGILRQAEKEFEARVERSCCAEEYRLALSVPRIGPQTARAVVCELPEDAAQATPAQIASYAGLAPMDCSSGRFKGASRIGKGSARLKAALYMAAVGALKTEPWARESYARMRGRGKSHQTAIVAVMRRLLLRVHAVIKRGSPWKREPQVT